MTLKELKEYWRKKIGIRREQGLKMYVIKYGLKRANINQEITVQMFLESLLPFTPNCLREVNQTILRQLQTQHMDMTVESIYHKLISISIECLYLILILQREINLPSWQKVQAFMVQDIVQKGKRIDLTIKETTDVIYVRKWMELWVNKVDQYQVLNMMRFFNGGDQHQIAKMFDHDVKIHMKCNCQGQEICDETSKTINVKSKSKGHKNALNADYFTYLHSQKSKSRPKFRFYTQTSGQQKNENKSTSQYSSQTKNQILSSEVQQISTFKPQEQQSLQKKSEISLFLSYVTTLVENQKQINFNRIILLPYKKQIDDILHDMLSKKKNWTKCEKILLYIERFLGLRKEKFEKLIVEMGDIKIENSVAFLLFRNFDKKVSDKVEKLKQISTHEIMQTIARILYKFISTRKKLIMLSRELIQASMDHLLAKILQNIGRKNKKVLSLGIEDLKEFLMKNTQKSTGKQHVALLMSHLGDGAEITTKTLARMFRKQVEMQKNS